MNNRNASRVSARRPVHSAMLLRVVTWRVVGVDSLMVGEESEQPGDARASRPLLSTGYTGRAISTRADRGQQCGTYLARRVAQYPGD